MNLGGAIRLNPIGVCVMLGVCILVMMYITNSGSYNGNVKGHVPNNERDVNLRELLIASMEVAKRGGLVVREVRKAADADIEKKTKSKTKEGVDEPVTKADRSSHCLMYYGLINTFKHIKVISEEHVGDDECDKSLSLKMDGLIHRHLEDEFVPVESVTIWIDPLDATKEYTENLLQYVTTMVCVAVKGQPVIGVIHKPFGEPVTSWGWVGTGHSPDIKNIVEPPVDGPQKIIVSRSHAGDVEQMAKKAFGSKTEIIQAAGAGYKVLEVVNGNATAYFHRTAIKKWDICAGNAIANSVGGQMTTLKNEELDYSSTTSPLNADGLLVTRSNHKWFLEKIDGAKQ